ncbi:MAG: cation diffusion facilitator family transporter [Bacteriovoracaceae bacterium]|jgi:cobalt-zinc-cadmium efflux system protein|nr:cation transporter [Halobacteriovoraceae bacterium]MDP7322270.1 cation diffusion facilitator family transporter [Bacteriovoracaceae bacterium]|tara:strand:- start:781 stop:1662 length:882 start_codon:yes stop_codon:yes gene_type:complete
MSEDHDHNHYQGSKNILVAFVLNATFSVIELIGGYLTNSVAIYSDALHDFGDSLALLFSYFAEKLSQKEEDENYTFGYRRFSILSAFINGVILLAGSIFVIYEAIGRIMSPEAVKPEGMLGLAILGISVNAFAAYRLSKNEGLNAKMVMYHLLEDLLGWVAVLIVSIILLFKPWFVLDSILSILISLVILRGVYKNLKKVGMIFLQKFPDELELNQILEQVKKFNLVDDIHAVKGWSLDNETFYLRFHIKVPEETIMKSIDKLKIDIKEVLKSHNVTYSTIEFESQSCEINNA